MSVWHFELFAPKMWKCSVLFFWELRHLLVLETQRPLNHYLYQEPDDLSVCQKFDFDAWGGFQVADLGHPKNWATQMCDPNVTWNPKLNFKFQPLTNTSREVEWVAPIIAQTVIQIKSFLSHHPPLEPNQLTNYGQNWPSSSWKKCCPQNLVHDALWALLYLVPGYQVQITKNTSMEVTVIWTSILHMW